MKANVKPLLPPFSAQATHSPSTLLCWMPWAYRGHTEGLPVLWLLAGITQWGAQAGEWGREKSGAWAPTALAPSLQGCRAGGGPSCRSTPAPVPSLGAPNPLVSGSGEQQPLLPLVPGNGTIPCVSPERTIIKRIFFLSSSPQVVPSRFYFVLPPLPPRLWPMQDLWRSKFGKYWPKENPKMCLGSSKTSRYPEEG